MSMTARRLLREACALTMAAWAGFVCATPSPMPPVFDAALLPPVTAGMEGNPYRHHPDRAVIVQVGRSVYNQSCAVCHGADANRLGPAPALRIVGRFCQRIADVSLRSRCQGDADHYFYKSVMEGKVKLGVTHMPAWREALTPEALWAVRTFLEAPAPADARP